jgi:hypothetical protein
MTTPDPLVLDRSVCESCGGESFDAGRCGGCGKVVCLQCVLMFDHWGDGAHGRGDPEVELAALREENERLKTELDEAYSILASTTDRLNVALRESGCAEVVGDPYHSLAILVGVVALYDRGARWRYELAKAREENARLRELEVGYDRWKVAAEKTGQHLRLARAELEKARYSAGQFCGAHIGKKYAECPVCSRVERDDRVHELEEEVETLREENVRLLAGLQGAAAAFEQAAEEPRALAPQPEESDAE